MSGLSAALDSLEVMPGSLALCWLGQAGFACKTPGGALIFIDAYLSDMCETTLGGGVLSKRLVPSPLQPEEITHGLMVSTHAHQDHLDEEAVAVIASKAPSVHFAGPISCVRTLSRLHIPAERVRLLTQGEVHAFTGFSLRAVGADHGDSEPDAIGVVLEAEGLRLYHTGDTAYRPERFGDVAALRPDAIIACINGAYGNLSAVEAARLAASVGARVAIPSHFWLFAGQNTRADATPAAFLEACAHLAPHTTPVLLTIGEVHVLRRQEACETAPAAGA